MGFRYKRRIQTDLLGRTFTVSPTAALQRVNSGSFIQAFTDGIKANFAADGLYQFFKQYELDPQKNYVDYLEPDLSLSGADAFGEGNSFPITRTTSASAAGTRPVSGDTALKVSEESDNGVSHQTAFRVAAGRTYRITFRWTCEFAGDQLRAGVNLFQNNYATGGSFNFFGVLGAYPTIVSAGTFQYDSFVFTAGATDTFCRVFAGRADTATDGDLIIDEILIDPVGEYFYGTNTAGTSIADNSNTIVPFTAVTDYGSGWSTNVYYAPRAGAYQISAAVTFDSIPDNTPVYLHVNINGVPAILSGLVHEGAATTSPTLSGTLTRELARADTIEIYATQDSVGAEPLSTAAGRNWLTIKRLD